MKNFSFANPVKIIFGKDSIEKIKSEIPSEARILLVYGGGSILKNGVYQQVKAALEGFVCFDFPGIEVNPHFETCMKAVEVLRTNKLNFILAVGGGSVLDASKFIACAACFEGDPWDIIAKRAKVKTAIPVGTVLTLFATGSEMNGGGVITKHATKEKKSFETPLAFPKFSVLDPSITFSLPPKQVGNGIVDAFVHVTEQYLTSPVDALIQDRFAESIISVLISEGPTALHTNNFNQRANLMWAATWALNGWIGCGVPHDWATHLIGHEITALFGLDHAQTLAIVLPGLLQVLSKQKEIKICQLGERVWGIDPKIAVEEKVTLTINAIESFFESVGVKTYLSDYNLGDDAIEQIVNRVKKSSFKFGEQQNVDHMLVDQLLRIRK